jgi:hypothetical protein
MPAILKFIYPNGKIYVARDMTHPQVDTKGPILDFGIRKETLWEATTANVSEVSRRQTEYIQEYQANDPAIGYNRWPKFKRKPGIDIADSNQSH